MLSVLKSLVGGCMRSMNGIFERDTPTDSIGSRFSRIGGVLSRVFAALGVLIAVLIVASNVAVAQDYPYADQTQANYYDFNGLGSGSDDFGYWILRSGTQPNKAIYGIGDVIPLAVGISPILDYKFTINGGQPAGLAMNTGGVAVFTDVSFFYSVSVRPLPNVGASSGGVSLDTQTNTYGALYFLYTVPEDVREIETPQSGNFGPLQTMWPTRIFFTPDNEGVTITRTNGDSYQPDQLVPRRVYEGTYFTDKGITNLRQVRPIVDGTRPTLQSVTSRQLNGAYRPGDLIIIDATFSEKIFLNVAQAVSNPVLTLNSGGRAVYVEGAGTPKLSFSYTVLDGESAHDLDVTGVENHRSFRDRADNSMASADVRPILPPVESSLAGLKDLRIDAPPTLVSIDANVEDGAYIVGDEIEITVTFDEEVIPTGEPELSLNSGGVAPYASGSGSNVLTFVYRVAEGESTDDLNVTGFGLNSINRIDDIDGDSDSLVPSLNSFEENLADRRDIVVNGVAPRVTDVYAIRPGNPPATGQVADGTYGAGTVIDIEVEFDDLVFVELNEGSLRLPLDSGGVAIYRQIATVSRGGEDVSRLTFRYTVGEGQTSSDLNNGAAIELRNAPYLSTIGPTVRDVAGNNAIVTLATGGVAALKNDRAIVIADTSVPTITKVSSPRRSGFYYIGRTIPIEITFSENVTVDTTEGSPMLTLNIDGVMAEYTGYDGAVVTFTYTVLEGHDSDDLDATELLLNGAVIRDLGGNIFTDVASFPTGSDANSLASLEQLVISTNVASVSWINGNNPALPHTSGDRVEVVVVFSVVVLGRRQAGTQNFPYLTLNAGSDARAVLAEGGSPDRAQSFYYTVQDGDFTDDLDVTGLVLNGGTIETGSGGAVTLDMPSGDDATSLASRRDIRIDAVPPSVATITAVNGVYTTDDEVTITVTFSEIVTVTLPDQMRLSLNVPGDAIYADGSGTEVLTFTYTVVAGENVDDLDVTGISAPENILDIAENPFDGDTLPTAGEENSLALLRDVIIDTPPMVTGITTATPDGSYREDEIIDLEVTFSEVVNVTGVPDVPLNSGGDAAATYHSGTGSDVLTFRYVVVLGEASDDLNNGAAIVLNNGGIQDERHNNLLLTLATSGEGALTEGRAILIDAFAPSVVAVSSPTADGTYKAGDTVTIQVDFSERITLTPNDGAGLTLPLNSAGDAVATFTGQTEASVNGETVSRLSFLYTVAAGENAVRLNTGAALSLNGVTIRDAIGHDVETALPTTGAASLAGDHDIRIDNTAPTVTLSRDGTGTVAGGQTVTVSFAFSEDVTGFDATDISVDGAGAAINDASFEGSGDSYSVTLTAISSGEGSAIINITANGYTDLVGNLGGAAAEALTFAVEAIPPTVTISGPSGDFGADYRGLPIGDFEVTIHFSEAVDGFAAADDVTVTGGSILETVAAPTMQDDGTYLTSATIRPEAGRIAPITIALAGDSVSDLVGNGNPAASLAITPALPIIYVSADASRVNEGDDAVFSVLLSASYLYPVTFWHEIVGENGLTESDYDAATPPSPVIISVGQTQATVTVPTNDDGTTDNPGEGLRLRFSSSDLINAARPETPVVPPYVSGFTIAVIDDEAPGVTTDTDPASAGIQTAALTVIEEDPAGAAYTVRLNASPTDEITVTVMVPDGLQVVAPDGGASLSFTSSNWDQPQTVIVTADADDDGVDRSGLRLVHMASGTGYAGLSIPDVRVNIDDDDTPALLVDTDVTATGVQTAILATPEGGSAQFTVRLTTEPTSDVSVAVTAQTGADGGDADLTADRSALTFTPGDWDMTQIVTITAVEDTDSRFGTRSFALTASGGDYGAITGEVTAREADNDPPTVIIELSSGAATVNIGAAPTISFTLSAVADTENPFAASDIILAGDAVGRLSAFTETVAGTEYTVVFTPDPGVMGSATLSIAVDAFAVGTVSSLAASQTIAVDTIAPTVSSITAAASATLASSDSVIVTFTFSEPVTGFDLAGDVAVTGGALALVSGADGDKVYTATFTPAADFVGTAAITVTDVSYSDLAGNDGGAGALAAGSITVDTVTPTVEITSDAGGTLVGGDRPTVTFTFSEAVTGFDIDDDVSVAGGQLRLASGSDGGAVYIATFTPAANFDGAATITLNDAGYTDIAGNPGDGDQLGGGLEIDTAIPTATLARADGGSGAIIGVFDIRITFSEAVTGFYSNDLALVGGTVTEVTGDGEIWNATIRPHRGYSGALTMDLVAAAVTDEAGNANVAADRLSVTAALPEVTIVGVGAESVDEGENKRFRVRKPVAYPYEITVAFAVEPLDDGDAADFTPPDPQSVTFAAGARGDQFFNVRAVADLSRETGRTEGFRVTLTLPASNAGYALGSTTEATATIHDRTREPIVRIGNAATVDEGGTLSFTLVADRTTAFNIQINYLIQGSGITAADIEGSNLIRSVTMPADATTVSVDIRTIDDNVDEGEGEETLTVVLLLSDGYKRSSVAGSGDGIIRDSSDDVVDPPDPEVEGDPGLILTMQDFFVPEDRNRVTMVSLAVQPTGDVMVTTERTQGDLSLRVDEGAALTFTTENWGTPRRVSIFAAPDAAGDSGAATFTVTASGGGYDGISASFTAREEDDEANEENHPTIAISRDVSGTLSRATPADASRATILTFVLSALPDTGTGLAHDDITITGGEGGSISAPQLMSGSETTYTAIFTAADNFEGTAQIVIRANAFQHNSVTSQPAYYTIPVDTIGLPVEVDDIFLALPNAYIDAPDFSGVKLTNPETCCRRHIARGQSFTTLWLGGSAGDGVGGADLIQVDLADFGLTGEHSLLTVQDAGIFNGASTTYEGITLTGGDDYGRVFTVPSNAPENAEARVRMRMRDQHGNYGPWAVGSAYAILDNTPPTVTITSDAAGDRILPGAAATITFTFSEPVREFDQISQDIRLADPLSGVLSDLQAGGDRIWSATFTANADYQDRTSFDVAAGAAGNYEDYAGLRGSDAATPLVFTVNLNPEVTGLAHANGLTSGIVGAFDVAVTFSEPVTGFDDPAVDVTVTNGSAAGLIGSGTDYVATIYPDNGHVGDVSVAVPAGAADDVLGFGNLAEAPITLLVALPAASVAPVADAVNEGQPAQFIVSLDEDYPSPVTVAYSVTGTQGAEAGADFTAPSATSVIFYPGDVARTVTVETLDDDAADAAGEGVRLTVVGESADNYIPGGLAATVALTDNDKPGLTVSPPALTLIEGGAEASYTIVLNAQPTTAVTVTASASGEVLVATGGAAAASVDLSFTTATGQPGGWDMPQSVTARATADDDATEDLSVITHSTSGGDPFYDSTLPASQRPGVAVTVADDDVAAMVIDTDPDTSGTQTGLLIILEGEERSFTVTLGSRPTAEVVLTIVPEPVDVGGDPDIVASTGSLTFTTARGGVAGWDVTRTVTISAADDVDKSAGTRAFTITARGGDYEGFSRTVTAVEQEDDGPTVSFTPPSATMVMGETATLTFTLSEAESDQFTIADIVVTDDNGATVSATLSGFSGAGASYSVTFTPPTDFEGTMRLTIPAGAFVSDTTAVASLAIVRDIAIDTLAPTATITSDASTTLNAGQTAEITITFSEDVSDFDLADLDVVGGSLGPLAPAVGPAHAYSATFTPDPDSTTPGNIRIAATADHRDAAGNQGVRAGAGLAQPMAIDTAAPTVIITSDASGVQSTGAMVTVTFSFSEPVVGFEFVDVEAVNGDLTPASFQGSGAEYSVTFTPSEGVAGFGDVAIKSTAEYMDAVGNAGSVGASLDVPFAINTSKPTVTLARADGGSGAVIGDFLVTITFSEVVVETPVVSIGAGASMLGALTVIDALTRQATIRPDAGHSGDITIDVAADTVMDAVGNGNQAALQLIVTAALPTVSVAAAVMSVNEGQPAQFTLSLDAVYPWPVTVTYGVTGTQGATAGDDFTLPPSPDSSVVFASGETAKSVSVETINDETTDALSESVTLTLETATNAGVAVSPDNAASVRLQDDDQPGLTVSTTALSVTEGGSGAAYELSLNTQPDSDVVITVTASDDVRVATGGGTAALSVDFTFTGTDWNVVQNVSVTVVDDDSADDETATLTHSVTTSAGGYDSLEDVARPVVAVTISDDDEARLVIDIDPDTAGTQTGVLIVPEDSEGRSETRRFTVVLSSEPVGSPGDVSLLFEQQDSSAGGDTDLTAAVGRVVFRTTRGGIEGWDIPLTIDVNAADDADRIAGTRSFTITAIGGDYEGLSEVVTVQELENDGPSVTITGLPDETMLVGATAEVHFRLSEDEDDEFDIDDILVADGDGAVNGTLSNFSGTGAAYSVTFTPPENYEGTLTLSVRDGAFASDQNGITNGAVSDSVIVDTLAPTVTLARSDGGTAALVGEFDVDITFSSAVSDFSVDDDLTITGGSVTGTVSPPSDPDDDGTYATRIRIRPDVGYAGMLTVSMGAGAVTDLAGNDNAAAPGLTVSIALPLVTITGPTGVAEGAEASFTVSLGDAYPHPLTIPFTVTPADGASAADITVPATLSVDFAAGDVADQIIIVATVDDSADEADTEGVTVALTLPTSGAGYGLGTASGVTVSIADNDAPTVSIAAAADVVEGGTLSFPVTVARPLTGTDELEVGYRLSGPDISAADFASASLTGTATISATAQALLITTADDDIDEGASKIAFVTLEAGTGYRIATGVMATGIITDDDTHGIALSSATLNVPEGGTAEFTVTLTSQPTAEVVLTIVAQDTAAGGDADLTASPGTLTFTTASGGVSGWDVTRTVTISAADDMDRIAGTRRFTITATGGDYAGPAEIMTAREREDDGPTVTFGGVPSTTMVMGETATFTFTLSEDEADEFDSNDILVADGDGAVSGTLSSFSGSGAAYSTTFTPPMDYEGTVTITIPAGAFTGDTTTIASIAISRDIAIDTLAPQATLTRSSGSGTIIGDFDLNLAFPEEVTGFDAGADLTISGGSVGGTSAPPRDDVGDGNPPDGIYETTVRIRPDLGYAGRLTVSMAAGAVTDVAGNGNPVSNELAVTTALPVVTIAGPSASVVEGADAAFTVSLSAAYPHALTVPFGVTPMDGAEAADFTQPTTLTVNFAAGDATDKIVTLGMVDDAVDEVDTEAVTVTLTPPASGAGYNLGTAPSATVSITDNDDPAVRIAAAADVVEGGTLSFPVTVARPLTGMDQLVVGYRLSGAGVSADDFTANRLTGSATISATTTAIEITTANDGIDEGAHETLTLTLEAGAGYRVAAVGGRAVGTITDDDGAALVLAPTALIVEEGGINTFTVALATEPTGDVTVTTAWVSGDADLTVSMGGTLTFMAGDWDTAQTITLAAAEDDGDLVAGTATFSLSASGGGYDSVTASLMATEQENDAPTVAIAGAMDGDRVGAGGVVLTFTLSATPTSGAFGPDDISATNADVSGFGGSGGTSYTLTVTPRTDDPVTVSVRAAAFSVNGQDNIDTPLLTLVGDVTLPTLSAFTVGPDSRKAGAVAEITITFSEAVTGFTAADIVATGGALTGFSGTDASYSMTFTPTADSTTDGRVEIKSDAVYTDLAGNAGPTGAATPNIPIDTSAPTVTGIATTTPDGSYKLDGVINIEVTFSEAVSVTGTPQLTLNSGAGVTVDYSGDGSPATTQSFTYTVAAGENADALDVTAIILNSGTITDSAGNDAVLDIPSSQNLGDSKNIIIDTTAPTVVIARADRAATDTIGDFDISITLGEAVAFNAAITIDAAQGAILGAVSGSGTAYTATVRPAAGYTGNIDISVLANAVMDTAGNGNPASNTLSVPAALPTLSVTADAAIVTEGAAAAFTLSLDAAYPYVVTAPFTLTGAGGATAGNDFTAPGTLSVTFAVHNTDDKPVTVATTDDDVAESGEGVTLTLGTLVNAQGDGDTATVMLTDNDTAGITISRTSLTVPEGGTGMTYTVAPNTTPAANIAVTVTAVDDARVADADETAAQRITLNFLAGNKAAQTVTVTGVADDDAGDDTASITHTTMSTDSAYNALTGLQSVTVTITDDDTAGLVLDQPALNVPEDGSATFTVALTSRPTGDVVVMVAKASGDTDLSVSAGASLTFTDADWATPQDVTIAARDDSDFTAGVATFTLTAAGGDYTATETLTATEQENDAPTVTISGPASGLVKATGVTLTFTLSAMPDSGSFIESDIAVTNGGEISDFDESSATVYTATLSPTADGVMEVSVLAGAFTAGGQDNAAASLTLTGDMSAPVLSSVVADDDALSSGETATVTVTFSEAVQDFTVDDIVATGGTLSGFAGSAAVYTVIFTPTSGSSAAGAVSIKSDAAYTDLAGNAGPTRGSTDPITVDTAPPMVTGVTTSVTDGTYPIGAEIPITVSFSEVVVVTGTPQLMLNNTATVDYGSGSDSTMLTFPYTVAAGQDSTGLNVTAISLNGGTIKDPAGNDIDLGLPTGTDSLAGSKNIATDTTVPTVGLARTDGLSTDTIGEFDVTVTFSEDIGSSFVSDDLTVVGGAVPEAPMGSGAVWTVTIRPDEGRDTPITIDMAAATVTDLAGNNNTAAMQLSVGATLPTVSVTAAAMSVTEGRPAPFTISLDAPYPYTVTAPFTITGASGAVASDDFTVPGTLSVSFDENDAADKAVSVTTIDDQDRDGLGEGVTLTLGTPTNAQPATIATATVGLNDNDIPGLTITPTSLTVTEGTAGQTYTVAPNTAPAAGTAIVLVTAPDAARVNGATTATLTFDSAAAQTVTVTTPDDDNGRAEPTVTITHTTATSTDLEYQTLSSPSELPDVTVMFMDDDTPALVLSDTMLAIDEGSAQTFTVVLATAPTDTVIVAVAMDGNVSVAAPTPVTLSFSTTRDAADGWNVEQTVTLAAADDSIQRDATATVTLRVSSPDTDYDGQTGSVALTVTDNDTPGVTVDTDPLTDGVQTTLTVNEWDTVGAAYTVVLDSEPAGNVTVTLTAEGQALQVNDASTAVLTFTPAAGAVVSGTTSGWNVPQPVVVTAYSDANTDNESLTITHSAASSADPEYDGLTIGSVTVTVQDSELLWVDDRGMVVDKNGKKVTMGLSTKQVKIQIPQPKDVPGNLCMATVELPKDHGIDIRSVMAGCRVAAGNDEGRDVPPAAGDPGPYVVQFTPQTPLVMGDVATVCMPLGPDQNPNRTNMYQADDTSGAWQGPLTKVDSASGDTGVICAETRHFSIFRLYTSKGLETADRGDVAGEWLGRFGRMVAEGAVDTIADRVRHFRDGTNTRGRNVVIGGRSFTFLDDGDAARPGQLQQGYGEVAGAADPLDLHQPGALANVSMSRGVYPAGLEERRDGAIRLDDLVHGSSFEITMGAADGATDDVADGTGGTLTFWGVVNGGSFDAGPRNGFDLSGDAISGHIGVDYATQRWLFGLDLAHSWGDGAFTWTARDAAAADSVGGKFKSDLTSVHPYIAFRSENGMSGWLSLGMGLGTLTFTETQGDGTQLQSQTDTDLLMVAGGGVVEGWHRDRFSIDMQAELFALQISSDRQIDDDDATLDMAATEVKVAQARVGLTGRGEWVLDGGTRLAPSVELQMRGDGGQAETGLGVEAGANVQLEFPQQGLAVSGGGRYLLAHSDRDYREWRADLSVRYDPLVSGEGIFVELSPRYGVGLSAGGDVWSRRPDELVTQVGLGTDRPTGSLALNIGHGASESARGWRRIEPWFGYEDSFGLAGSSSLTLGGRYRSLERLELEVTGRRRMDAYQGAQHEINLQAILRF